ncbi:MAG: (d)CMP kinase [Oscillospiraceae bacterium]|jgi:cytidylate kinase|nr:(d)CMP kinase [Oscillospiraceae bacterium]
MYSVAIDGPSGAGKSTLAKRLARHLGWVYVDTGAVYRAVGLACERLGVAPKDEPEVTSRVLPGLTVELNYSEDGTQITLLCGEDVSTEIRRDVISRFASDVSSLAAVRQFLLELQRDMAKSRNVVMDGRDIGTVVIPDATLKIFLTAIPEVRAMRRQRELERRGEFKPFDEVLKSLEERDKNDSSRANAPLKQADGAVKLDTSDFSEDDAFNAALELIKQRIEDK